MTEMPDSALTLQPIDCWRMIDDLACWLRPDLTEVEARDMVDEFLADIRCPGFNPGYERYLVHCMDDVRAMFVPLTSTTLKNVANAAFGHLNGVKFPVKVPHET
jgi:hypothetical protein